MNSPSSFVGSSQLAVILINTGAVHSHSQSCPDLRFSLRCRSLFDLVEVFLGVQDSTDADTAVGAQDLALVGGRLRPVQLDRLMGLIQQKDDNGDHSSVDSDNPDKENVEGSTNGSGDPGKTIYYGVHNSAGFDSKVYTDRAEALRALKANKKARLKAFADYQEAVDFSCNGCDIESPGDCPSAPSSPIPENSNFKGPKSQDLIKFRKAIEKHDFTYVRKCVDENPRYLISSGDTPQILQEGSRFNALHVAARASNASIAKYICETVKSIEFMNKLYGASSALSNLLDRGEIMLDLYLNTPDKGANETPLHFASKLGAVEVVRVLVSYKQCDRARKNKFGDTPKDLVCSRAAGPAAEAGVKNDILFALEGQYYVAVMRSPDNAFAPKIPEPFSHTSPLPFADGSSTPKKSNELDMIVSGVAGPMTESDAKIFRKKWKTPPRKLVLGASSPSPVVTDPEKGVERVGRALATDFRVPWKEYWGFLEEFVDLSSPEGLLLLENHLKRTAAPTSKATKTSVQNTPSTALSPISDLCNNFRSLSIVDVRDDRPKVSPYFLDNSSSVFATRLALSLPRGLTHSLHEMERYQDFLRGCSKDPRFSQQDLSTAHYRLACLVHSRLNSPQSNSKLDIIESVLAKKTDNCSKRSFDCLKCVLSFVKQNSKGTPVQKSCDCPLWPSSDCQNNNRLSDSTRAANRFIDRNGYESDDDDSDEYFTPPSSPLGFDIDGDDDEFLAASDSPELFIEGGSKPSKVDFDVYHTIAHVLPDLVPSKYPSVYFWSCCITKHLPLHGE